MGNGVCSRRQRRIFQCLLLVTVVCGVMYGGMISYEMHQQLRRTEAMALKYQQHQESLSAQLQVVYEHRSRLEKSLQKERLEHKKAKEDFLVYKLEAQQSINKEKQDSTGRLNSLQVQHQMLKNQHDDLKRQYYELHDQHKAQDEDHGRLLEEHKERYSKLEQTKEVEITQLKDNLYNLREENKQLRKSHQDIHMQLQGAQVQHQHLKDSHDLLALTLEDHKNALAAAQAQVDEYKRFKESVPGVPSQVQHGQNTDPQHPQADAPGAESHVHDAPPAPAKDQINQDEPVHADQLSHQDTESRLEHQVEGVQAQPEARLHTAEAQNNLPERDEEGEAERKRELAEEEMAQAGQPQKLEDDPDQQEEEEEEEPLGEEQPDENALDRQRRQPQLDAHADLNQEAPPPGEERVKSPYEEQQEQQRLEAQRAEERRQIQLRQESLQAQRDRVLREREERLKQEQEREHQQNREADRREQLLREEHQRKRTEYENMDNDIVQGEEDRHADDEESDVHMLHQEEEEEEKLGGDHRVLPHQQGGEDGDVDPEDDPNNQGEDEFEEAEDEHRHHQVGEEEEEGGVEEDEEPAAPARHAVARPGPEQPAVEEELVMAGNPDQQEDTLDDQYQEEGEDEPQEDIPGEQKREEEEMEEEDEETYNEENLEQGDVKNQEGPRKGADRRNDAKNPEEENYEEEEEEEEEEDDAAGRDKGTNRRAEM